METVKVSCRLSAENVGWLDEQVQTIGPRKTSRNAEIEKAIVQRRLSLLPKWQQEKIAKHIASQQAGGAGGGSAGGGGGEGGHGDAGGGGGGETERVEPAPQGDLFEPGGDERGDEEGAADGDGDGELNGLGIRRDEPAGELDGKEAEA